MLQSEHESSLGWLIFYCSTKVGDPVDFCQALELDPGYWPALESLENVKSLAVDRWHYRMLNHSARNEAYSRAIKRAVTAAKSSRGDSEVRVSIVKKNLLRSEGDVKHLGFVTAPTFFRVFSFLRPVCARFRWPFPTCRQNFIACSFTPGLLQCFRASRTCWPWRRCLRQIDVRYTGGPWQRITGSFMNYSHI